MFHERTALISDVHARPDCLGAVMDDIRAHGITAIVCLGDVVGYGNAPVKAVRLIASSVGLCLLGNHDLAAVHSSEDADGMNPEHRQWLETRALTWSCDGIELVHASLDRPEAFIHLTTPAQVHRHFRCQRERIAFFGHTHVPVVYHRQLDGRLRRAPGEGGFSLDEPGFYAVGVGSVAFSRDQDKRPCWVEYVPGRPAIHFHRVG